MDYTTVNFESFQESDELTKANSKLAAEIESLRQEKDRLVEALRGHLCARHQEVPEKRKRNSA